MSEGFGSWSSQPLGMTEIIKPSLNDFKAMRSRLSLDQFLEIGRRLAQLSQMCHFFDSYTQVESAVQYLIEGAKQSTTFERAGGRAAWETVSSMLLLELPGIPEEIHPSARYLLIRMFLAGIKAYAPPADAIFQRERAHERARERFMLAALRKGMWLTS